ncbi:MAG: rRNA cytosine-C5-methyltransferase [Bacteroidaceae bacterium]|nr:rRNA cytosine-C5-methyltransferase [Bacteroidaceae bacterium]
MELPSEFISMLSRIMPGECAAGLSDSLGNTPSSVSIRLNARKLTGFQDVLESLDCCRDGEVPWASDACYLDRRPSFISDPLFHQGLYYVQEASSMFVEQAVRRCVNGPVRFLDLCAAPGGKSTLIASLLPEGSILVSNEIQRGRANILAENMVKWGRPGVMVTCNTPCQIGGSGVLFDVIAVDAPCSGEGMFRKEPKAVEDWSMETVQKCADRQRGILSDVWSALKPGGFLIYSTCTFNLAENEENVHWIIDTLGAEPVPIDTDPSWNITGALDGTGIPVYRFMQNRTRGEGFFLALLQKNGTSHVPYRSANGGVNQESGSSGTDKWVLDADSFRFCMDGGTIYALPYPQADDMLRIGQSLYPLVRGTEIARLKGRDLVPAHALAMSGLIRTGSFCNLEVSREEALSYLRCEALRIADAPKGILLLTYSGRPLGFVKNIGNRANNMYPSDWRIRISL